MKTPKPIIKVNSTYGDHKYCAECGKPIIAFSSKEKVYCSECAEKMSKRK